MKNSYLVISIIAILWAQTTTAETDTKKSTQDLSAFIGKWKFVDEATELAGFEYRDEGTLNCYFAYENNYIKCDGESSSGGKNRTYSDFLNYNSISDQYEWVGIFGNHPEKAFFVLTPSEDGRRIEMRGKPMQQRNGTTTQSWAIIQFEGGNRFIWKTYLNRSTAAPDSWPLSFIGKFERVK